ncbi:MAG: hypothetical protein J6Y36_02255 [Treponema sp.]|nr:hypothetical protein [Treponema sp.]
MSIYTSSFNIVLNRRKSKQDYYIQLSRDLGEYEGLNDDHNLENLIDENWGYEFGNWWGDKPAYKKGVSKKDLRRFAKHLRDFFWDRNVFLLCFENVLSGEICHRQWLSEILEKSFGLHIEEWRGEKPAYKETEACNFQIEAKDK